MVASVTFTSIFVTQLQYITFCIKIIDMQYILHYIIDHNQHALKLVIYSLSFSRDQFGITAVNNTAIYIYICIYSRTHYNKIKPYTYAFTRVPSPMLFKCSINGFFGNIFPLVIKFQRNRQVIDISLRWSYLCVVIHM